MRRKTNEYLGPVSFDSVCPLFLEIPWGQQQKDCSEESWMKIDKEIKNILMESYEEVYSILNKRRGHIEKIAIILLERETLEGGELEKLLQE